MIDSDPFPGLFKVRLKPNCPWVAARVWLDWPRDDEGRLADRPRRLACKINGEWADLHQWWPRMFEIGREEYEHLLTNPPDDPWARTKPRKKNDGDERRLAEDRPLQADPAER